MGKLIVYTTCSKLADKLEMSDLAICNRRKAGKLVEVVNQRGKKLGYIDPLEGIKQIVS